MIDLRLIKWILDVVGVGIKKEDAKDTEQSCGQGDCDNEKAAFGSGFDDGCGGLFE